MNTTFLLTALMLPFAVSTAFGFATVDHRLITESAYNQLVECHLLNEKFNYQILAEITKENLHQDNYFSLSNVLSKWFKYSHFYTPLRPLESVGALKGRKHSDLAIHEYKAELNQAFESNSDIISRNSAQAMGRILHHIQDAASPLHAFGINHGLNDGFENKLQVGPGTLPLNCQQLKKLTLSEPNELLDAAALQTLKRSNATFPYMVNGNKSQISWSMAFFSNSELINQLTQKFLNSFNLLDPKFNYSQFGITDDWRSQSLKQGQYGLLAKSGRNNKAPDNFGSTNFIVSAQGNEQSHIQIEEETYIGFKRGAIHDSIVATQKFLLWANDQMGK